MKAKIKKLAKPLSSIVMTVLVLSLVLTGCISFEVDTSVDNSISGVNEDNNLLNVKEQISVEIAEFTWEGDKYAGALIQNKSNKQIGELEIQFLFYDSDDNIIGTSSDGHDAILPGSTVVSFVSDIDVPQNYHHIDYKLEVDVEANSGYINHTEEIDMKTNIGEDCVILQIKNNADITIEELEYAVVFYKNDKIVDMTNGTDVYDIKPGDTVIEECSSWGVDYDTYKVFINQAHTF